MNGLGRFWRTAPLRVGALCASGAAGQSEELRASRKQLHCNE
jgi:hypothetical protein